MLVEGVYKRMYQWAPWNSLFQRCQIAKRLSGKGNPAFDYGHSQKRESHFISITTCPSQLASPLGARSIIPAVDHAHLSLGAWNTSSASPSDRCQNRVLEGWSDFSISMRWQWQRERQRYNQVTSGSFSSGLTAGPIKGTRLVVIRQESLKSAWWRD